jgi:hypothetical protein
MAEDDCHTPGTRQVDEDVCQIWKKKIAADIPDLKYTYVLENMGIFIHLTVSRGER